MITFGAFLNGKLVCTITVDSSKPRDVESALRCLRNSYPEATIYRKL